MINNNQIIGILLIVCGAITLGSLIKVINITSPNLPPIKIPEDGIDLGQSTDHLIWFLQISDLHLSIFHDKGRITDFKEFCNVTVDVIKPSVVLASGDLTHAMESNKMSSTQFKGEWKTYSDILQDIKSKTVWLDVRGNHDNYDVASLSSINNYYQNFSIQGTSHKRSYMYSLKKGTDSIAFIAVDASQIPGPKRPYNFVGIIPPKEMELLQVYEREASNHNYTIWFGHYPTSCIISAHPGLRKLVENGYAYLCGHFHDMYGLIPHLYTIQQAGSLELELSDWKENRFYRVAAFDNGLFSFIDIKHGTWPVILITNPKHAQFLMNWKEPLSLIKDSSHIRVLVWSPVNIKKVIYRINNSFEWMPLEHIDGPLYVAQWAPKMLTEGIHTMEIEAVDVHGNKNIVSQPFSIDGSSIPFIFTTRLLLMSNLSILFQFMMGSILCISVVPLCVVRIMYQYKIAKIQTHRRFRYYGYDCLLRKIWVLASIDKLFYPLILACLYVPIGPWFIGEILNGHIGVAFAWGIFVYSSYIPGSLTYLYGFLQILTFHLPLMIVAAVAANSRYAKWYMHEKRHVIFSLLNHGLFSVIIANQIHKSYQFFLQYGIMASLLGPLRTWSVFFAIYIWYVSSTLRRRDFRSVAVVWG